MTSSSNAAYVGAGAAVKPPFPDVQQALAPPGRDPPAGTEQRAREEVMSRVPNRRPEVRTQDLHRDGVERSLLSPVRAILVDRDLLLSRQCDRVSIHDQLRDLLRVVRVLRLRRLTSQLLGCFRDQPRKEDSSCVGRSSSKDIVDPVLATTGGRG